MRKLSRTLGQEKVAGYVFILPFIIGLIVFTVIPFFTSLYLAFTEYDILTPPKWIAWTTSSGCSLRTSTSGNLSGLPSSLP